MENLVDNKTSFIQELVETLTELKGEWKLEMKMLLLSV